MLAAKRVGDRGQVYAFEPIAKNIQSICAGIVGNGFGNITVIPVAASDRAGAVAMYRERQSSNGIVNVHSTSHGGNLAPTNRVDSLLAGITRLDVIKIDIEGYEPCAWKGMGSLVEKFRPIVFSEFSPVAIRNTLSAAPADYLKDLFEFSNGTIEVLHRDVARVACVSPEDVMREWHAANERMNLKGNLHLDLLINNRMRVVS